MVAEAEWLSDYVFISSVDEFEHSYNTQNARLVIMDRIIQDDNSEFFRLDDTSTEALNLKGEVSSEKPVYWRGNALDNDPYTDDGAADDILRSDLNADEDIR